MKNIIFVTGNSGKVKSLEVYISKYGYSVQQIKLDLIEPQGKDAKEIAMSKAIQAWQILKKALVVEDSSFHIKELNGFPGPYIKYLNEIFGANGILKITKSLNDRSCWFESALVYVNSRGKLIPFVAKGDKGLLASRSDSTKSNQKWSDLWRIFIPKGFKVPLTALSSEDWKILRKRDEKKSTFSKFARYLKNTTNLTK